MNIYLEIDTYTISMYAYMMYMLCKDFSYVNYANVICIYKVQTVCVVNMMYMLFYMHSMQIVCHIFCAYILCVYSVYSVHIFCEKNVYMYIYIYVYI